MSDATNAAINNLSCEEDDGSVKLQTLDDEVMYNSSKFATMKNKKKKKLFVNYCRPPKEEKETKDPLNYLNLYYKTV